MRRTADVAELAGDASPFSSVTRARARESVSDLVQQRLVNRVVIEALGKVTRDRNALAPKVAQAGSARGSVEGEAPRIVEVQRNEGLGPVLHSS
jgi:hypothetical protein